MQDLGEDYWTNRYLNNETAWDLGEVSPPLKNYFNTNKRLQDKSIVILIPGAGNAYEAEYLFMNGFLNVHVIDIAAEPLKSFSKRLPSFPESNLICGDFFSHSGKYNLIIEQTFFCALNPALRASYVKKMNELLAENGKLVGLLFNDELNKDKPPFGGFKVEYEELFEPYFKIEKMEPELQSVTPRLGRELFIEMSPLQNSSP